jgi:hypothetical protein
MQILEQIRDTAMNIHQNANKGRKSAGEKLVQTFSFEYRHGDSWATPQSTYYSVQDPSKRVLVSWAMPVRSDKPSVQVDGTDVRMEYLSADDLQALEVRVKKMFEALFELKADDDRQREREERRQTEDFEDHKKKHVGLVRGFLKS